MTNDTMWLRRKPRPAIKSAWWRQRCVMANGCKSLSILMIAAAIIGLTIVADDVCDFLLIASEFARGHAVDGDKENGVSDGDHGGANVSAAVGRNADLSDPHALSAQRGVQPAKDFGSDSRSYSRREVVAINPSPAAAAHLRRLGFSIGASLWVGQDTITILIIPTGMDALGAIALRSRVARRTLSVEFFISPE